MPIDPFNFVLGQNRSFQASLSDKPRSFKLTAIALVTTHQWSCDCYSCFCILRPVCPSPSLLNLGPKQVNQQSFTQLLAFYSLLISSTITAKTHQAVYGQMRFILPRIAIKLRVNCRNTSSHISFCILQ